VKSASLADEPEPIPAARFSSDWRTSIDQPEVHDIYRAWRRLADSYAGDRVLVGEVTFSDPARIAPYLRPDELQLGFNFSLVFQPWDAAAIRASIDESLAALPIVTWVLENHDVTRLVTRFGTREARAAALLLLALPGPVFLYQGQELGLEEVDLPDDLRQDPIFLRTRGERKGRDGCRIPVPWLRELPEPSWLPVPATWSALSVEAQREDDTSTLALYRTALRARRESNALREGTFRWFASPEGALVFAREAQDGAIVCAVNVSAKALQVPIGEILLASEPGPVDPLPPGAAAWVRLRG
jgi:alpha-glucosidase